MRRLLPLAPLVLVAACVRPAPPPPAPTPAPTPPPVEVPQPPSAAGDWRDRPYSPGTWSYARDDRGSIARYGTAGAAPDLAVRCERATRQIRLLRAGAQGGGSMRVQTTTGVHAYATRAGGGAQPAAYAEMPARDAGLDAMAFSRGRWIVMLPGAPDLVVPSWPEFSRVVEDCRG